MLHFFRKIRRDLLANSKFFKYLKYAIGEIVLVVLGILIALYINNRNEERKALELGITYLKEMRLELERDVVVISRFYLDRLKTSIEHQERVVHSKNMSELPLDSLKLLVNPINLEMRISEVTFNKMKNLGISELTDNDKLNARILTHYNTYLNFFTLRLEYWNDRLIEYEHHLYYDQDNFRYNADIPDLAEYKALFNLSESDLQSEQREGVLNFMSSVTGQNLILDDLQNKKYALNEIEHYLLQSINLLQVIDEELKKYNQKTSPLTTLPEGYFFKRIQLPSTSLEKFTGNYQFESNNTHTQPIPLHIFLDDGNLYVKVSDYVIEIFPYEESKFAGFSDFIQVWFELENNEIIGGIFHPKDQEPVSFIKQEDPD